MIGAVVGYFVARTLVSIDTGQTITEALDLQRERDEWRQYGWADVGVIDLGPLNKGEPMTTTAGTIPCRFHNGEHILTEDSLLGPSFGRSTTYKCDCGLVVSVPDGIVKGSRPIRIEAVIGERR